MEDWYTLVGLQMEGSVSEDTSAVYALVDAARQRMGGFRSGCFTLTGTRCRGKLCSGR